MYTLLAGLLTQSDVCVYIAVVMTSQGWCRMYKCVMGLSAMKGQHHLCLSVTLSDQQSDNSTYFGQPSPLLNPPSGVCVLSMCLRSPWGLLILLLYIWLNYAPSSHHSEILVMIELGYISSVL